MKKFIALALATVMCVASLTACGNTASSEATESAATESTATAETTGTEAASTEATAEKEVWVVGTNAEFPPFEYIGDDGQPDGFDIALIKAIGEKMGMEVEIQNMEFASLVAAIGSKIDASIAGMTVTEERQLAVDFSDNYYEAVQYVVVKADSDLAAAVEAGTATAADLENKKIGVQLGTTGNFIADEIAGAEVSAYNKAVDAVNDLINGRVELVIIDKNPAEVFNSKFEGQLVIVDGATFEFEPEFYAIALPKGSDMVDKVNAALAELKEDGTFDALVAEYIEGAE